VGGDVVVVRGPWRALPDAGGEVADAFDGGFGAFQVGHDQLHVPQVALGDVFEGGDAGAQFGALGLGGRSLLVEDVHRDALCAIPLFVQLVEVVAGHLVQRLAVSHAASSSVSL
jgi:hypothetical protein